MLTKTKMHEMKFWRPSLFLYFENERKRDHILRDRIIEQTYSRKKEKTCMEKLSHWTQKRAAAKSDT